MPVTQQQEQQHTNKLIATTILQQLGGNKFLAMTGAKNLVAINNGLQMKLPSSKSKANLLTITLTPLDTYNMTFEKFTQPKLNKKTFEVIEGKRTITKAFTDLYYDQLQELFTEVTGMYTTL